MSYGINPIFTAKGNAVCQACGSQNAQAHYDGCPVNEFIKLRNRVEKLEREVMSAAMWCDPGKHAFSSNDEGMETLSRTKVVQDDKYGGKHEVTYQVHICGEHIVKLDPFGEHADENKTQALEAWNEGFEAGRATAE